MPETFLHSPSAEGLELCFTLLVYKLLITVEQRKKKEYESANRGCARFFGLIYVNSDKII